MKVNSYIISMFFICIFCTNYLFGQLLVDSSLVDSLGIVKYTIERSDFNMKTICIDTSGLIKYYYETQKDMLNGAYVYYYNNGMLKSKCFYENGSYSDTILELYPSGDTSKIGICYNHKCDVKEFYESGALKANYEIEGIGYFSGYYEEFCENGQLKLKLNYRKKIQDYNMYGCDGKLLIKGQVYKGMQPIGGWEFYWPGSSILQKEGEFSKENGEVGIWKYYTEEGELDYEENY